MSRTATPPRIAQGVSELSDLSLKVAWPILDDSMFDREAMAAAQKQWAGFLVIHGVRQTGAPRMWVAELDDWQRRAFGANRAVVCTAPVVKLPEQLGVEG